MHALATRPVTPVARHRSHEADAVRMEGPLARAIAEQHHTIVVSPTASHARTSVRIAHLLYCSPLPTPKKRGRAASMPGI